MGETERTVLFVDDEENILRALVRLCRRDGYKILTANSGKEGLKILEENKVAVIVSDQLMPEMCGTEFMAAVKEKYPETMRLVLSGYTDLSTITDAINHGAIYKFLTKPWDDNLLRDNIRKAFEDYELVSENRRLTSELQMAYQGLERHSEINLHALQFNQDILENLPVGVIGIDDERMVIMANKSARQWLSNGNDGMIGQPLDEISESASSSIRDGNLNGKPLLIEIMTKDGPQTFSARISDVDENMPGKGWVMVIYDN